MKKIKVILFLFSLLFFSSCKKESFNDNVIIDFIDFEYLKGTWVDKESFALQFINFQSENQAKFGFYGKEFEKYDPFNYRIIEPNRIAINFIDDDNTTETFHDVKIISDEELTISDLAITTYNHDKVYLKRDIITDNTNDTIIIGYNQIYFDFKNNIRLQMNSVFDSRCPINVLCIDGGYADVKFDLIVEGNYEHNFVLSLDSYKNKNDTIIGNINYKLVDLNPYPESNKKTDPKDYIAKIVINK
jgi:hypothetical protein